MSAPASLSPAAQLARLAERVRAEALTRPMDEPWPARVFDAVAADLFALQYRASAPLRAWWDDAGRSPTVVRSWRDVPPVPNALWRHAHVGVLPAEQAAARYRSSGTSARARSTHAMPRAQLDLYRALSVRLFAHWVLPDGARPTLVALLDDPHRAPESSLVQMVGFVASALCSEAHWCAEGGNVDPARAREALAVASAREGDVLVAGTAFGFVQLCDAFDTCRLRVALPAGSRAMITGGFKGRTRTVPRDALLAAIERSLGIPPERVVDEYGMAELTSQAYAGALRGDTALRWHPAPWMRAAALDPRTHALLPPGEPGVLALWDLANVGTCLAVLTGDVGFVDEDGCIHLEGRSRALEPRGCSLAFDLPPGPAAPREAPRRAATHPLAALPPPPGSPRDRARALEALVAQWLDPRWAPRAHAVEAVASEAGMHPRTVAAGLDAAFAQWTAPALERLAARLDARRWVASGPAVVVAAGNVPVPVAFDVACCLIAGFAVRVRPSSHLRTFARAFAASLRTACPQLAPSVEVVDPDAAGEAWLAQAADGASVVVLNGSDETIEHLRALVPAAVPLVARGSRVSVGVADAAALLEHEAWLNGAARDVCHWDQRGCLSPAAWILVADDPDVAARAARALDAAIARCAGELPPGRLDLHEEVAAAAAFDEARAQRAAGAPLEVGDHVVFDPTRSPRRALAGRRLWAWPVRTLDEAYPALQPWRGRLSAVALACDGALAEQAIDALTAWGATRFHRPGQAQAPPADWSHDGLDPIAGLVRFVDTAEL